MGLKPKDWIARVVRLLEASDPARTPGRPGAARLEKRSVSKWVRCKLERALCGTWPDNYFELLGSLADADFERPPQPPAALDARKGRL